jgi:type IV pilus assembly protein PilO
MSARAATKWQERLASPLSWHYVGLAALIALVIGLAVRLGFDWSALNSDSAETLAGKQVQFTALNRQTAPLRGLDQRVAQSREQMQEFYAKRIPADYSSILTRTGELGVTSGVRLSRVQYAQGAPSGGLTEISMDAGVTGTYPQIMRFVNGLERDKTFFVIRAMALTGQQGGMVNLRLRLSTWLRTADAAKSGLPRVEDAASDKAAPAVATTPGTDSGTEGK